MGCIVLVLTLAKAHVSMALRTVVCLPAENQKTLGILDWHGTEDDRIDQAEDRGIGADAGRQGQNGYNSEAWRLTQHAPAITHVLCQGLKKTPAMYFTQGLAGLRHPAEGDQSLSTRLVRRHS